MTVRALYAGSFDPITIGHLDIIKRASRMFDEVIVGVGINANKPGYFAAEERCEMIRESCSKLKNVKVESFEGLTATFAKEKKCHVLVRGLRDAVDFGYEIQMSHMNRHLAKELETIFIPTTQEYSGISSSLVKEVARLGGDVSVFLPKAAFQALHARLKLDEKQQRSKSK